MNWLSDTMRKATTWTHRHGQAETPDQALPTLLDLHSAHAGKVTDKWSGYFGVYDRLLPLLRNQPIALLEVGIQNGGSLEVWAQYFPRARKIIGVDIDLKCSELRFDDPRIRIIVGDINSAATLLAIHEDEGIFDLIIDDGSHVSGDIVRAFCHLWPRLAEGGLYIVEDMCCSYWSAFDGGLHHPASSEAFFKSLSDCINAEHWGNGQMAVSHISSILERHEAALTDDQVAQVHSIEIANSIVTIRKAAPDMNRMGKRVVGGSIALVNPGVLALDGTVWVSEERDNCYSRSPAGVVLPARVNSGYCPCCEQATEFWERDAWLRDHYICKVCESIPRMRALQHVLASQFPHWKQSSIHESSPSNRNIEQFSNDYSSSQYYGNELLGSTVPGGVRNENLDLHSPSNPLISLS